MKVLGVTGNELFELDGKFEQASSVSGLKVVYAMSKNHNAIKSLSKELRAKISKIREEKIPRFETWDNERLETCKAFAKKDDKGEFVMISGNFQIDDMPAFEKKADELKVKYKDVMDALDKKDTDVKAILDDNYKLELHSVKMGDITDQGITKAQMDVVLLFMEE